MSMPNKPFTSILAALVCCSCSAGQDGAFAPLDAYLKQEVTKGQTPSVSVAVVKNGKVVYAKGFGYADIENEVPAEPQTVYRLGSITKQFTATMIMQLVQEGKLTLDTPMRKVLPDTPVAWDKVTVRELLNHTSGIKSYTEVNGIFEDAALKPTKPDGILKTIEKEPLDFAPGSDWHYDNTGYEVLGMIIEKLDGRAFAASLHARILDPLGMTQTYFTSERTIVKHRAQGYSVEGKGFVHCPYLNMDWPYAAGSMESTTLDLAKWDAALYGDKILPQSALKQMWTESTLTNGTKKDYGFGWQVGKVNGFPLEEHGGGIHGFTTFIRRVPAKALTVIVLTNSDAGAAGPITIGVMGIADPSLAPVPPKGAADDDPAATAAAKALLETVLAGNLDRSKFSDTLNKKITPDAERSVEDQLSAMGKINDFEFGGSKKQDGIVFRSYWVTLGSTNLKMEVGIDGKGFIAMLTIHP